MLMGGTIGSSFLHTGNWLEGYEDFFSDLAGDPDKACKLMDKVLGGSSWSIGTWCWRR